jgi:hypothetical protein
MRGFYGVIAGKRLDKSDKSDKWVFRNGVIPGYVKVLDLIGLKDDMVVCIETPGAVPFYKIEITFWEPASVMEPDIVKEIVGNTGKFNFVLCGHIILFSDGEKWLPYNIKSKDLKSFDSHGWALDRVCQDLIRVAIDMYNEDNDIDLNSSLPKK